MIDVRDVVLGVAIGIAGVAWAGRRKAEPITPSINAQRRTREREHNQQAGKDE